MNPRTLSIFVPGHPKTKGSMHLRSNGTAAQSVVGSTRWAILMAGEMRRHWNGQAPMVGALYYAGTYVLPVDPLTARSGDGDKLERNVWDALQGCVEHCAKGCKKHAGVIGDDVQFVQWAGARRKFGPHDPIGVHILVGEMP